MSTPHPASPEARTTVVLGVIGGSGLYAMPGLERVETRALTTPFGEPSGPLTVGELPRGGGAAPLKVVFVPRHGAGHVLLPGEINARANLHALKQLGVTHVLSVSAVGSLQEEIPPGDVVIPRQFIDRTKGRPSTFFGDGVVAHVQFGHPIDDGLATLLKQALAKEQVRVHDDKTMIVMEGPAFSTKAESMMYRSWGADIIGMTALPEAKLAREAELAYAILATSTDYDCWHEDEAEVTVDAVLAVLRANVALAQRTVGALARALPEDVASLPYPRALDNAIMTAPNLVSAERRAALDLICGHHLAETND
jgi:5'-methylthioadenosine phosphorylase